MFSVYGMELRAEGLIFESLGQISPGIDLPNLEPKKHFCMNVMCSDLVS